jgi:hypothetical protein
MRGVVMDADALDGADLTGATGITVPLIWTSPIRYGVRIGGGPFGARPEGRHGWRQQGLERDCGLSCVAPAVGSRRQPMRSDRCGASRRGVCRRHKVARWLRLRVIAA